MNRYLKKFINLTLLGIGLGILVGSLLKIIALKNTNNQIHKDDSLSHQTLLDSSNKKLKDFLALSNTNREISLLSLKWKELANKNSDLDVGAYFMSLDNNIFAELTPDKILPAASTIKIPILLVALEMVDTGNLLWNEPLQLEKELIAGGAGWMAYEQVGKTFPTHEVATEMIRVSDNTATNLLIHRLGGINVINKRLKEIGLINTQLKNLLPDLKGTNTTTAKDLAIAIAMIDSGNILSQRSRDLFREIMSTSVSNKLIPAGILKGLGKDQEKIDYNLLIMGYRVYNKTGDIGISYSDAAIIQMPDNTKAIAGFMVKGPFNDPRSPDLIRDMAAAVVEIIKPKSILNLPTEIKDQ